MVLVVGVGDGGEASCVGGVGVMVALSPVGVGLGTSSRSGLGLRVGKGLGWRLGALTMAFLNLLMSFLCMIWAVVGC